MLNDAAIHIKDTRNRPLFDIVQKYYFAGVAGEPFSDYPELTVETSVKMVEREAERLFQDVSAEVTEEHGKQSVIFLYSAVMRAWQAGARVFQQKGRESSC